VSLLLALAFQLAAFLPVIAQDCPEEPGETPCTLADGSVVRGYLRRPGAVNVYRFEVAAPATTALVVLSELPADYDLYLTDEAGQVIAQSVNDGVYPEVVHPELPAAGSYFVHVFVDSTRPFVASAPYRLQLALRVPSSGSGSGGAPRPPAAAAPAAPEQPTATPVPTATPAPPPAPTATATAVPQTGPRPLGHAWDGQGLRLIAREIRCPASYLPVKVEYVLLNRTEHTLNFEVPAALFYIELNTGQRLVGTGRPITFDGLKPDHQQTFSIDFGPSDSCGRWTGFLRDARANSVTLGVSGFNQRYLPGEVTWREPVNDGSRVPAYSGVALRLGQLAEGDGLSVAASEIRCPASYLPMRVTLIVLNRTTSPLSFNTPSGAFYLETSTGVRITGGNEGTSPNITSLAPGNQTEISVELGRSGSCGEWEMLLRDNRATYIQVGVIDLHRQRLPGEQRWRQAVQH
jgi:hypothetical protein